MSSSSTQRRIIIVKRTTNTVIYGFFFLADTGDKCTRSHGTRTFIYEQHQEHTSEFMGGKDTMTLKTVDSRV